MPHRPDVMPWVVRTTFLLHGATFSAFLSRIPSTKVRLGLPDSVVGLALTVFGTSAILGMQLIGLLTARWGGRRVMTWSTVALPVALVLIGVAPRGWVFVVAVVPFGAVAGFLDVTMNAEGVAVENEGGRPVLSSCHASWSIGSLSAAALAYLALRAGTGERWHFGVNLVVVLVAAGVVYLWLPRRLPRRGPAPSASAAGGRDGAAGGRDGAAGGRDGGRDGGRSGGGLARRLLSGWSPLVAVLGLMGFVALLTETAVGNWSGIYLHTERGEPLPTASLGYVGFVACQTAARLVGDRWRRAVGAVAVVRVSGVLAAAGLTAGVAGPWLPVFLAGFCLLGLGLANILPIVFGAVGHSGDGPGAAAVAVSRLTTLTYLGSMLGPAAIGALAQVVGLRNTLAGLVPLLVIVILTAGLTAGSDRAPQASPDARPV